MPNDSITDQGVVLSCVTKGFPGGEAILGDCSFTVEPGKFTVLLGPSGCGKTTLVRLIAGYDRPDSGSVLADGRPVAGPGADRMVVFQESALFPWMSLLDNVAYGPLQAGVPAAQARREAGAMLDKVGLGEFAHRFPAQLSGGMQRRAEVVRALINRPRLLLLDEPFRGLDHMTRGLMQEFILRLFDEERPTILFVTSEVDEAVFLADTIVVLSDKPATVKAVVDVPLPRPRRFEIAVDPAFGRVMDRVMGMVFPDEASP
jgi:ABC-type nitrate/sulfonate/bicarbonate transport system, ATPase component